MPVLRWNDRGGDCGGARDRVAYGKARLGPGEAVAATADRYGGGGVTTVFRADDRFDRVDRIFDAALDLPPDQQTAFIARECGDDEGLCAEVLELVRAYRQADLLDAPAARMAAPLLDAAAALAGPVPERIGAFRVVREIG